MSLLGKQVYANPDTPLWLSTTGGTIDGSLNVMGSLTVDGTILADGAIRSGVNVSAPAFVTIDASGTTTGLIVHAASPPYANAGMFFQGDEFRFGKIGTGNVNTTLVTSVYGANQDNFTVGGTLNCLIGPVPTQIITSTKTVSPIPVSPSGPTSFGVDTTITGISNAEYDVQMVGSVSLLSGTMDASDSIVFNFVSGGGAGTIGAGIYPAATGAAIGNFGVSGFGPLTVGGAAAGVNIRTRITPNASGTILGANVRAFSPNASTAVYGANLTLLDVQRVR